ncbi:MAG TPA: SDR family NAD(P)-dependent oxidoreductase, partial [Thermoanaerobaculia bacterium]|nr:SDR family NAD(P)-dependent oxidoreductase [Thermoanaerobaculia bacterium]
MKIANVRALVTGGSSGIGFEIARQLKEKGGQVVICGREQAKVAEAAKKIGANGIRADVSIEADATALVRKTVEILPDYNVLVNNAGFGSFA